MARQGARGLHIIMVNGMRQDLGSTVVDENCWHMDLQFVEALRCERRIADDQGIHLPPKHSPNQARLTLHIILKCRHKHTVLELMSHALNSTQDFTVEGISYTVDNNP